MVHPWKRKRDEVIFENQYAKLERVTFELPDGKEHDFFLHGTPEHLVSVLAVAEDGRIILAREYRPGPDMILDEIPGGLMDEAEEPMEAARRELLEETGYTGNIQLLGKTIISAYSQKLKYCFIATECKKVTDIAPDEREIIEVVLKDKEEFVAQVEEGLLSDMESALWGLRALESRSSS